LIVAALADGPASAKNAAAAKYTRIVMVSPSINIRVQKNSEKTYPSQSGTQWYLRADIFDVEPRWLRQSWNAFGLSQ
jgi:hypothetical protein